MDSSFAQGVPALAVDGLQKLYIGKHTKRGSSHPEFQDEIPVTSHKLRYAIVKTRRILANRWKYRMVSDERIGVTMFNLAKKRI